MRSFLLVVALLTLAGCKVSNRTLSLPGTSIGVGPWRQVLPLKGMPMVVSSDGSLYAVAVEDGYEVRKTDSSELVFKESKGLPLLFAAANKSLFVSRSDEGADEVIYRVHLTTGLSERVGTSGKDGPYLTLVLSGVGGNQQFSMLLLGDEAPTQLLTNRGKIIGFAKPGAWGYDEVGRLWLLHGKRWTRHSDDGSTATFLQRPKYIVKDCTKARGSLSLVHRALEIKSGKSVAYATAIWLDHRKKKPDSEMALIDVSADVYAFGFVPGRELVYVVTSSGTKLVPFHSTTERLN